MTQEEKQLLFKGITRVLLILGECVFLGIAIGSVVTEHVVISRIVMAGAGIIASFVFFVVYLYFVVKYKIKD